MKLFLFTDILTTSLDLIGSRIRTDRSDRSHPFALVDLEIWSRSVKLVRLIYSGFFRRAAAYSYSLLSDVIRRRLTFGGVRRRWYTDRKAELPLIAAYSDVALRTRRLDGQDDTADESDCTGAGDLQFIYDCKRPLQCYQVRLSTSGPSGPELNC